MEALQILLFAPCVKHRGFLKVIQLYFRQGPTGLLIKVMHLGGGGGCTQVLPQCVAGGRGHPGRRRVEREDLDVLGRRDSA